MPRQGQAAGVQGRSASTEGKGVFGDATATSGFANGVVGQTASPGGAGVYAVNLASSGGVGVNGTANATSGSAVGVLGQSASTSGQGVNGYASAPSGNTVAIVGGVGSPNGVAGQFVAHAGAGLVLQGLSGSNYTQVFTVDASGNGYFGGNLNVTGNLTKGSGWFKIDHPLDPENKYLSHSFVESPDMMDVYNGNVITDKRQAEQSWLCPTISSP